MTAAPEQVVTEPGLIVYPQMQQREEWRAIPGHTGYEVSNFGRVRSYRAHGGIRRLSKPKEKATFVSQTTGYLSVTLQKESGRSQAYPVHVLVASAFLGPRPEGLQVAHADGDKTNARLENLRYATAHENAADKIRHGTHPQGETNGNHKLSDADVRTIRSLYRAGALQKSIANSFGVSQQLVSRVVRDECWRHLAQEEIAS